jgi:hypothetical protein
MKDCKTFLKFQEVAGHKQAKARSQGYEGNTNNTPPANQQQSNGMAQGQNQPNQGNNNDGGYIPSKGHITAMIQPVPKSNKEEKRISREVNLAVISPPVTTEYLHWSEQPIEFNREDHPIIVHQPENAPLILKAHIRGYDIERVFNGCRKWNKPDICQNTSSNAHITGVPQTNSANYPLGQQPLELQKGEARLQGHGLALSISRDPRATRVFTIHGSTSLYLHGTQDARTNRNHHSKRDLQTLRPMRQGIPQDGAKFRHDSYIRTP